MLVIVNEVNVVEHPNKNEQELKNLFVILLLALVLALLEVLLLVLFLNVVEQLTFVLLKFKNGCY